MKNYQALAIACALGLSACHPSPDSGVKQNYMDSNVGSLGKTDQKSSGKVDPVGSRKDEKGAAKGQPRTPTALSVENAGKTKADMIMACETTYFTHVSSVDDGINASYKWTENQDWSAGWTFFFDLKDNSTTVSGRDRMTGAIKNSDLSCSDPTDSYYFSNPGLIFLNDKVLLNCNSKENYSPGKVSVRMTYSDVTRVGEYSLNFSHSTEFVDYFITYTNVAKIKNCQFYQVTSDQRSRALRDYRDDGFGASASSLVKNAINRRSSGFILPVGEIIGMESSPGEQAGISCKLTAFGSFVLNGFYEADCDTASGSTISYSLNPAQLEAYLKQSPKPNETLVITASGPVLKVAGSPAIDFKVKLNPIGASAWGVELVSWKEQ